MKWYKFSHTGGHAWFEVHAGCLVFRAEHRAGDAPSKATLLEGKTPRRALQQVEAWSTEGNVCELQPVRRSEVPGWARPRGDFAEEIIRAALRIARRAGKVAPVHQKQ